MPPLSLDSSNMYFMNLFDIGKKNCQTTAVYFEIVSCLKVFQLKNSAFLNYYLLLLYIFVCMHIFYGMCLNALTFSHSTSDFGYILIELVNEYSIKNIREPIFFLNYFKFSDGEYGHHAFVIVFL